PTRDAARSRPTSATTARAGCPGAPRRDEAASPSRQSAGSSRAGSARVSRSFRLLSKTAPGAVRPQVYDRPMASGQGLTLLVGPANAGKVALLVDRYLAALDSDPVLIVPYGSDVERIERELLARSGALLAGQIGTFDDLFERLARDGGSQRPVVTDAQRQLIVRTAVSAASLNGLGPSARFTGFADALGAALVELESGFVEPGELDG